ncbi:exported hypothetical protein [metagenome]|uniref:Uncharacterized protein n=1 Tax=metagenome TaxID=256318 RepID=A0A2P2CE25_9ZZZZ
MTRSVTRQWRGRLILLVIVVVVTYAALVVLDFGPRPFAWALLVTTVAALGWLLMDAGNARPARWRSGVPARTYAHTAEDTAHARVLDGHLDSRDPGPALRDRLVSLARSRDPDLLDPELRALAQQPVLRLSPDDIDRYLSRIEALGDR